jgi:hypothetical protein
MSYKPDEKDWMAYLYGELEGQDKEKIDQYLLVNAEARMEFEKFRKLRKMMGTLEDKEVIAPPIFVGDTRQRVLWNTPYFKTIVSIAASLLLIIVAGKITGTRVSVSNREFRLSFGEEPAQPATRTIPDAAHALTAGDVQEMINASLSENNIAQQATLKESQQKLNASIRRNLDVNSARIDRLVREAATASQDQIREYVAGIQVENAQVVKDYFQLTSGEQKKYIEDLLVDFAEYMEQQHTNDLQVVQTQLNSLQQNTNIFKQETEQILTSIITTVGTPQESQEIKN